MTQQPLVTVIIPTYKDWGRLGICVEALKKQTLPIDNFEIIVVNNEVYHDVPFGFELPENAQLIHESVSGSYAARNKAIKIAKGEILAFTDSDCIPDKDWLWNAVNYFKENPKISRIGGKVELFYSKTTGYTLGEAYEMVFAFQQEEYVKKGRAVTANMITLKNVFDKVGLFNASMISGGDMEWSDRATKEGYGIVYLSSVVVKHPARTDARQIVNKRRRVSSHFATRERIGVWKRYSTFFSSLKPPIGVFKKINIKGKPLPFTQKIAVFLLRYYSNIVFSYSRLKAMNTRRVFNDRDLS